MDSLGIKAHFPIFQTHPNLVYLDSASTTQTPSVVLEAMQNYYTQYRANVHRGLYNISREATTAFEKSREIIALFIGAATEETIFTSGTTHGLNLLAYSLGKNLTANDNIVLSRLEHHANLIPWQRVSKRTGCELRFIEIDEDYEIDLSSARELIDEHTKIVSVSALSNTLGTKTPLAEIISLAQIANAFTVIDAAQLVGHAPINVRKLDCDFLVFSGHKMYGPTGIGILYGKKELLEELDPFFYGGEMIEDVSYTNASWNDLPWKFEAGTPPIAEAIGLEKAVHFIQEIGWEVVQTHERTLTNYLLSHLPNYAHLIGPAQNSARSGVVSFLLENIHPHDTAEILNRFEIAVRAGEHCTKPLIKYLDIPGTVRASISIYNDEKDIDRLLKGIKEVKNIFKL